MISGVLAILVSGALLLTLGLRDPKRLRNQHAHSDKPARPPMSRSLRRLLGWLSLVPGVVLMVLGEWWAFLVWLGAICVMGWAATHALAIRIDTKSAH